MVAAGWENSLRPTPLPIVSDSQPIPPGASAASPYGAIGRSQQHHSSVHTEERP
jgi:hypothetical protein